MNSCVPACRHSPDWRGCLWPGSGNRDQPSSCWRYYSLWCVPVLGGVSGIGWRAEASPSAALLCILEELRPCLYMSIHVVEFYVIYMKFKKIYTDHVKKIYVIYMVSKPVWILFIHLDSILFSLCWDPREWDVMC